MLKKFILLTFLLNVFVLCAYANTDLSTEQIERVTKAKRLLGDADQGSLTKTIHRLKKSPAVEGELQIIEAVAATYDELVRKYKPADKMARERLLDKIRMNMAYFQLGGPDTENPRESSLNIVIRRKLKEHLPSELINQPGFLYSLE